jgi:hypothetical protein
MSHFWLQEGEDTRYNIKVDIGCSAPRGQKLIKIRLVEEYQKLVKFFKSSKRSVVKRIGTTKLRQNLQNKTKQNKTFCAGRRCTFCATSGPPRLLKVYFFALLLHNYHNINTHTQYSHPILTHTTCYTTHNTQHTTHNTQHTTHNTQHTTHSRTILTQHNLTCNTITHNTTS